MQSTWNNEKRSVPSSSLVLNETGDMMIKKWLFYIYFVYIDILKYKKFKFVYFYIIYATLTCLYTVLHYTYNVTIYKECI